MYFRCYNKCPECLVQPCELTYVEMTRLIGMSTPCPIGESDGYYECLEGNEFFCMIRASQTFTNYDLLREKTDYLLSNISESNQVTILSSDTDGTNKLAAKYAKEKCYRFLQFTTDLSKGVKAAYERNNRMHKFLQTVMKEHDARCGVIVFWDGRDDEMKQSIELAQKYGNQLKVVRY